MRITLKFIKLDFSSLQKERKAKAEAEIQGHLDSEMDKLMYSKWSEKELPEFLLVDFKNAVMNNNPKDVQVLSHILFAIGNKKIEELTFGDVGIVVNIFGNAIPSTWSSSFDDYVIKRKELDVLTVMYNKKYKEKEQELIRTRSFMLGMYNPKTWERISSSKFLN